MYRVVSSEFVKGIHNVQDLGVADLPEVAFMGRSNVGKSSLLNAVCKRKSLARVGRTPGRTQSINLYRIEFMGSGEDAIERADGTLVDLPGYGFAKVSQKERNKWSQLLQTYLMKREQLRLSLIHI